MTQPERIDPPAQPPRFSFDRRSATFWLIVANVVVYFLDLVSGGRLIEWGAFSVSTAIYRWQVWRFATFQFLHGRPLHILVNMIVLYFFGPLVESPLGKTRFVIFYLLCGFGGAGLFVLMWKVGMLSLVQWSQLIGASAGIMGLMVAAAVRTPNQRVQLLLFFVLPVTLRMRTMVLILLGLAVAIVLSSGPNAGGEAAHLGGAALGFVLIRLWQRFLSRPQRSSHRFWKPGEDNFLRDEFRQ